MESAGQGERLSVAVLGATGQLGARVAAQLRHRRVDVGLSRDLLRVLIRRPGPHAQGRGDLGMVRATFDHGDHQVVDGMAGASRP